MLDVKILGRNDLGFGMLVENFFEVKNHKEVYDNLKVLVENKQDFLKSNGEFHFENKPLYAVLQKYGIRNENGRVYPKEVLENAVKNFQKKVETYGSIGETDHPESPFVALKNTSMLITDLWWEGATLMGKIHLPLSPGYIKYGIVSAPADLIANHIINGIRPGISSRALGSVIQQGSIKIVQDDLDMVGWDFVGTPSTRGSWTSFDKSVLQKYIERNPDSEIESQNESEGQRTFEKYQNSNNFNSKIDNFLAKYAK